LKCCRREVQKGQFPKCGELEDGKHVLIGSSETKNWRINLKCKKWLHMPEEITYKKIIICNNRFVIKAIGKYLFKVNGKLERDIGGGSGGSNSSSCSSSG
jgi:hypothetical protein